MNPDLAALSNAEFDRLQEEQANAPACGCCIVVAIFLRNEAAVGRESCGGQVYPLSPAEALEALRGTRWESVLPYTEPASAAKRFDYGRVGDALPIDEVRNAGREEAARTRAELEQRAARRAELLRRPR